MTQKRHKKTLPKFDGLNPQDIKRIKNALREVWRLSYSRKLCLDRALDKDGFGICELCKKKSPKNSIDHIIRIGAFDPDTFIKRLFLTSDKLQAICKECHDAKTKKENAAARAAKKRGYETLDDIED